MQKHIAIIGAGYAGLHLALLLQSHDITVTLFTNKSADDIENSQLLNTVARQPHSIERENRLGIDLGEVALNLHTASFYFNGEPMPLVFDAHVSKPGSFVDTRLYTATLLREFAARGGEVIVQNVEKADLLAMSETYSLVVVASGGKSIIDLFPRQAELSPYDQPQRFLLAGYFKGIDPGNGAFSFVVAPGNGDIFQGVSHTAKGMATHVLIEGIPGQGFQAIADNKYQDDPAAFKAAVLDVIKTYAPTIYARINPAEFEPRSPKDVIQGAITPVVRQGYAQLENGKYVVAVGDAFVLNDPIVGQGANTGIMTAWILGDLLVQNQQYDAVFCQQAEAAMWNYAQHTTHWANAFLQPPPPHVMDLLIGAAQNQALANAFVDHFNVPEQMWATLSDPARTAALIAQYTGESVPA